MSPSRLPSGGAVIDRSRPIKFKWNGKSFTGFEGDTIVSALAANGVDVFSRSMKYHRRRGILTGDFWDPNCFVQVGDEPNVRAGHRLISAGIEVSAQNVWPSLERDVKAANGLVGRFLTAGFYYKTFMKPATLWPKYEKILATFAPGGAIDIESTPGRYDKRYSHPDVLVAGGGPAGMAAAIAAAEAGADVMLVEHNHQLGGHLLWGSAEDQKRAASLGARCIEVGVEVLTDSTVTGRYDGSWVAINQRNVAGETIERVVKARAKCLVIAPGLIERPYIFEGNDRVGVMTSGAARRMLNMYGIKPGQKAVVFTANAAGDAAAADLADAGVEVTTVDGRTGADVVRASGSGDRVEQVELADGTVYEADLLVTAVGWTAPTSLANMSGDRPSYDPSAARFFCTSLPDDVLPTGGLAGDGSLEENLTHASATGRLAARRGLTMRNQMRSMTPRASTGVPAPIKDASEPAPLPRANHPELFRSTTHGLVDFSEDVGSKDLWAAAAEGFDSVELVKRFTTATMGPSQGKLETVNTVAVLAEYLGQSIEEVGTTVWRPPYAPVSLGALAGKNSTPHRISSIHVWNKANNCKFIHAGAWLRPDHYGNAQAEAKNVRDNVGIIDVTPLGKLDLQGPNVPDLLELLYVNKWRKLDIGKVRYGVMVGEDGVVLDDGVTARLGEEHYMMTTTSSGAASIWEWAENWLQTERPDWDVRIVPVTTSYTSINVAGPKSRELLLKICEDVDLSNEAFGYMSARPATVAGVAESLMLRIGFTGELSYEVHVPAAHGLKVWEALLDAGKDLGVKPFGLEAQRILRLEKGHFIVGQDTDGLTRGASAGLGGLIKLDKDDGVGLPELRWAADRTDLAQVVSIALDDGMIVPEEASQLVDGETNTIVGRITSSRMSPNLGRSVCMGQVIPELAAPGSKLTVLLTDGRRVPAKIHTDHAFIDPEGARLRA